MKFFSKLILISACIGTLISCDNDTTSTTLSEVAQITAFAFTENDSFPGLKEATFIVEQLTDTGLIRMRKNDSIRYGTPLDSIIPNITYYTTPSSVTFYLGDSAVKLTGYDTLNLNIKPIKIHVVAQNTDYDKWYNLDINVHTVDGDLFHWDTLHLAISNQTNGHQKAIMHNGKFYYYQNDGYTTRSFVSTDFGENWKEHNVTGLPSNCDVRQIVEGDSLIFYGKGHNIYFSSNGTDWDHIETTIDIVALYMCMAAKDTRLWLAAKDEKGTMRFYSVGRNLQLIQQIGVGLPGDTLPLSFPIEEYATVPFTSSSLHQHALIVGGYDRLGRMTSARWNLEYNYIYDTYHFTNMADEDKSFLPFAGTSVSYYGKFLYLLGGINEDRQYIQNVYTSNDEGMNWVAITDSTNLKKPEKIGGRFHTNSFVDENTGNLYIIGGEDNSTTYSDVYRGRMNSIQWPEIGD